MGIKFEILVHNTMIRLGGHQFSHLLSLKTICSRSQLVELFIPGVLLIHRYVSVFTFIKRELIGEKEAHWIGSGYRVSRQAHYRDVEDGAEVLATALRCVGREHIVAHPSRRPLGIVLGGICEPNG
jgi:hypothetical protein